ncbi:MAG: carboxypeptidase regulatory-like domain-containing protein [Terriglobales bacterium]
MPDLSIGAEHYDCCTALPVASENSLACVADRCVFFGAGGLLPRFLLRAAQAGRRAVLIGLIAVGVLAVDVWAQDSSSGAVRGAVNDASGGRIVGASVVLVNGATAFRYAATSDVEGRFAFDLLPPGDYTARAVAAGMSAQVTPPLHVLVGGILEVEFKLPVAGAKEIVTVTAEPPLVETTPTTASSVIEERSITGLPLEGRRFSDLTLLTPGVTQDPRGLTSGSNGDLAFGGIRGFQTSFLVDGGDNNNAFFAQATGRYRAPYQFSTEVVQEFRVSTNTYGAELGRSGGAVINVVTKSGSNHFHGTDFYYIRDSLFAATHPFMTYKPHDQQQQLGFTFGGPIKRNRAFFFLGFDQHIFHVPTVMQFLNGTQTIVPVPPGPNGGGDYEQSDAALVFATAAKLNALAGPFPAKILGNAGFAKVDFALSPRNTLSARVNTSRFYGSNNVFFDPGSPLTTFAESENGTENVATETGSLTLTSGISPRLVSHLRAQFTHDLEQSFSNSNQPLTRITDEVDGFGGSTILPRQTREHRLHLAETLGLDGSRHAIKFGGDALLTWIYNFFPRGTGGEYIFDPIKVNPFTFQPQEAGLELSPLRAYAHLVPKYYEQDFGNSASHPDSNEYSAFVQDTIRVNNHFALSLGVRYDLQTYTSKGLVENPLWLGSGRMPFNPYDFAPRVGFAYSMGQERPLVVRGGYGLFYTRIPQIYQSAVANENGLAGTTLFLNNSNYYDNQVFPHYPYPLVNCSQTATSCSVPASLEQFAEADVASFSPNFKTPHVEQTSLSLEKEVVHRTAVGVSYTFVHGVDLIRARDVNLPPPVDVAYPVYDSTGVNFLGTYYTVPSFSTWQLTTSFTCPYPPCINPLARPIPQLGAIDVFESAASSVYHGATLSIHRQMSNGLYFRLAYTYAHAIDDGQDALVAGEPATVQNSYAPNAEKGNSVTDQRQRFVFSWIGEPNPFGRSMPFLSTLFDDWKYSGVITIGSGRPVNVSVSGDPNQDSNGTNDRIPGASRNSFLGPDYATADMRLARSFLLGDHLKLELLAEAFNALNRDNQRVNITEGGLETTSTSFVKTFTQLGLNYYPGHYQVPANPIQATNAFAPREIQFGVKLVY